MKTIYSSFFALLITLSSISGQSLRSRLSENRITPLQVEFNDSLPNTGNSANELYFDKNKVSATNFTTKKKVANQSNQEVYQLDSIFSKDVNGASVNKAKYAYDSNGNQTLYEEYIWDKTNNKLIGNVKSVSTYNSNSKITLKVNYSWDGTNNVWIENWKGESNYDSNGNVTLEIVSFWDAINNIWKGNSKMEYTSDSNGNRTLRLSYSWDATNNIWKGSYKYERTYDINGNETLYVSYAWDATKNVWIGSYKYERTYDINGNETLDVSYNWDATNNIWKGTTKYEYNYDSNGNKAQRIYFTFSSEWVLGYISTYFYSLKNIAAVSNPSSINIHIYPNPAKNELQITGLTEPSKFSLFDLNGKSLMSKNIINNEVISISTLSKGIYIVRLKTSEGSIISKLIKE